MDSWSTVFSINHEFGLHGPRGREHRKSLTQVFFFGFSLHPLDKVLCARMLEVTVQLPATIRSYQSPRINSVSRLFKRFPNQSHRFNAVQVSMDCQPVIIGPNLIVLEALNKDVMGLSHSSLSGYITNHSKKVRSFFSTFIYKHRHSSLINVETVPRRGSQHLL